MCHAYPALLRHERGIWAAGDAEKSPREPEKSADAWVLGGGAARFRTSAQGIELA
jgi:hypothetical protein